LEKIAIFILKHRLQYVLLLLLTRKTPLLSHLRLHASFSRSQFERLTVRRQAVDLVILKAVALPFGLPLVE
jgi:hypothetical protein